MVDAAEVIAYFLRVFGDAVMDAKWRKKSRRWAVVAFNAALLSLLHPIVHERPWAVFLVILLLLPSGLFLLLVAMDFGIRATRPRD